MTDRRIWTAKPRTVAIPARAVVASNAAPLALLLLMAAAVGLGGCREHEARLDNRTAAALTDPSKRHPIGHAGRTEALYVEVATDGLGLSENQATDVSRFVDRYKSESNGRLTITAPGSVRGHLATSRSFREIEELVDRLGVPSEAISRQHTPGGGRYGPAVKLAYERSVAVAPSCGQWPEDMGNVDRERLPYENFGCASQRNLALTVSNARDLQVPQEETPRSSEARSVVWSKYVGASQGAGGSSSAAPAKGGAANKPTQ